jgi:precorrin-8X/cobalt-precorrin-8 methylmutase
MLRAYIGVPASPSNCISVLNTQLGVVSKVRLEKFGMPVLCPIGDADVAEAAKAAGHTRAIEAIRKVQRMGQGGVLVIGNAPTALTEAIRLVREEGWRPHLIIGVPVGFVSAAESKQSLADGDADPVRR